MADLDLEPIKAMLAAATPGPWRSEKYGIYGPEYGVISDIYDWSEDNPRNNEDMDLIAAAPTTIAALVAEVEANRAEIGRMRALMPTEEERDEAIDACAEAAHRVCWDPTRFDRARAWLDRTEVRDAD